MSKPHLVLATLAAVVIVLGGLAACSPLRAINALSPGGASTAQTGLHYGKGPRQALDLYLPKDAQGPLPVVVFFYGGNWVAGNRADYAFVGRALASRGIIAVIPDYRLYPEVRYPEFLDDNAAAVAWTAREIGLYGGDPARLFVMGHSAGAYNAAMLALDGSLLARQGLSPAQLRGWIGMAGPYDFIPIGNTTTQPVFLFPDTPPASQPINHVSAGAPPALLIAPRRDTLVEPMRNTGGLAKRLRAAGVPVEEVYYDGVSHTTLVASLAAPLRALAPSLDTVVHFIETDGGRRATAPAAAK